MGQSAGPWAHGPEQKKQNKFESLEFRRCKKRAIGSDVVIPSTVMFFFVVPKTTDARIKH